MGGSHSSRSAARICLHEGQPRSGRTLIQLTTSEDLAAWTPFQLVHVRGIDRRQANAYFFAVQANPVHEGSLVALTPLEHMNEGGIALTMSLDGVVWSEALPVIRCPVFNHRADVSSGSRARCTCWL